MKRFSAILFGLSFAITSLLTPVQQVRAATSPSITRAEAEKRALSMINLKWTYTKEKNGNIASKYATVVTPSKQLQSNTTTQMTGIPYNWGGIDTLDFHSYGAPWTNFLDAVNKGAYIGNANTKSGYGYIPGTAGVDCSGFVQATFHIRDWKLSTSTLFNKYFTKISLDQIKHMDILNKPGDHVVIFERWGTRNGVYGAFTYEATPDQTYGGIQGAKKYFISMETIKKGYIPGRYIHIKESTTLSAPKISTSTPSISVPSSTVELNAFAQVTNVQSFANFRAYASTSAPTIGTLPKASILYVTAKVGDWYKVNVNGKVGFIYGNLVGALPSGKYVTLKNASYLNMRTSPTTSSPVVKVLSKNDYAEVLDYSLDGTWMKVRIHGVEGWASGKYLSYLY